MTVQTSYPLNPRVALEGQLDNMAVYDAHSKSVEGDVGFGRAVVRGTNPDTQVTLPSASTPAFFGVAQRIIGLENPLTGTLERDSYLDTETAAIIRSGYIWVITEEAVVPGDPVYYRFTAGAGGTVIGRFRKTDDTATAAQIDGATFETTAAADSIVKIKLPAHSA